MFRSNCVDDIIWRRSQQVCDDGELVYMVLPWEQRLSFKHFCKDTTSTPNIYLHVVLLPGKHDFWCSIITSRHVASHLRILDSGQTKVTDFQIAVLIDKNVGRLEITMNNACGMDVFKATQDLIKEVLNELLLQRTRSEQSIEISAQQLGHKVYILQWRNENVAQRDEVFVAEMLEQFELSIGALGQHRR